MTANIPIAVLNDLASRFIVNVPSRERNNANRLMFQIEAAHWYYIDFYCFESVHGDSHSPMRLPELGVTAFTRALLDHLLTLGVALETETGAPLCDGCPVSAQCVERLIQEWRAYKLSVPTCGAILLAPDMKHVLLVQGISRSWSFPKGKCNESELHALHRCAAREVAEEVDYEIDSRLDCNQYLEHVSGEHMVRLYIITDVARDYNFRTRTRNEIRDIRWFSVSELEMPPGGTVCTPGGSPAHKRSAGNCYRRSFFTVMHFVQPLKQWIWSRATQVIDSHRFYVHGHGKSALSSRRSSKARDTPSKSFKLLVRDKQTQNTHSCGTNSNGTNFARSIPPAPNFHFNSPLITPLSVKEVSHKPIDPLSPTYSLQMCDIWKNFHLDRNSMILSFDT